MHFLLDSPGAHVAAKAYMLIEDVTRGCPETAQKSVKAVAKEVHDILVLRCLCEMDRKDHGNRDVFVVTVAKAFGQSFSKECRDMIFHVHRKVTWGRPRRRSPGPLGHPHLVPRGTSGHERLGALGDPSALRLDPRWMFDQGRVFKEARGRRDEHATLLPRARLQKRSDQRRRFSACRIREAQWRQWNQSRGLRCQRPTSVNEQCLVQLCAWCRMLRRSLACSCSFQQ